MSLSVGVCFRKVPCFICGKIISVNGLAMASHMRMHVRTGEAVETKDKWLGCLIFKKTSKRELINHNKRRE